MDQHTLAIAAELIHQFAACVGHPQADLNQQLQLLEGEETDYRIKRGLAHILRNSFSTFEIVSPLDPQRLRQRVFGLAAETIPSLETAQAHLETLAQQLTQELEKPRRTGSHSPGALR